MHVEARTASSSARGRGEGVGCPTMSADKLLSVALLTCCVGNVDSTFLLYVLLYFGDRVGIRTNTGLNVSGDQAIIGQLEGPEHESGLDGIPFPPPTTPCESPWGGRSTD